MQKLLSRLSSIIPYKNGAKNDPARAPQETPIICAINVTSGCASLKIAITADTKIKKYNKHSHNKHL
ncbi:hypothetical protein, partial [Dorea sp.]|uniref:hypothetical protein n=1 Tax=Dorea sp. TaxID=2040332 RepID=UPI0035294299